MAVPGNCWDKIAVLSQCTLKYVLGERCDIGNSNLHVAVDGMTYQQKLDAIMFLEGNAEGSAYLPDGRGLQTVVNVQALLTMLPTNIDNFFIDKIKDLNKHIRLCLVKHLDLESTGFELHEN